MPNYFYVAKSFDGEIKTGTLNFQDQHQLAQNLKKDGFILINAVLEEEKAKPKFSFTQPFSRVSLSDKIILTRNLGIMFSAGLSLVKTFDVLMVQARNKKLKKALAGIKEKINTGISLSDALSDHPAIFSELFVSMVKVGEESGTLEEVLNVLSMQLQREHELKSKIKNAMIYPGIILAVMILVGLIMITFVIPNLKIFFTTLNIDLPFYTKILLWVGDFFVERWYLLAAAPFLLFLTFFMVLKNKKGKQAIDAFLLKLPVISPIIKKNNSALLIRSLSSLIASGVALARSLEISSDTIGNYYFSQAALAASKRIKEGEKLSAILTSYLNIFPVGVVEMIEVGEETGKTSDILKKLADFYEQEAIVAIEKLTIIIEPVLIIGLGLVVGLFALSIIQPMYSSLQSITQ